MRPSEKLVPQRLNMLQETDVRFLLLQAFKFDNTHNEPRHLSNNQVSFISVTNNLNASSIFIMTETIDSTYDIAASQL